MKLILLVAFAWLLLVIETLPSCDAIPTLVPVWLLGAVAWAGPTAIPIAILFGVGLDGISPAPFGSQVLFCTIATALLLKLREMQWLDELLPCLFVLFCLALTWEGAESLLLASSVHNPEQRAMQILWDASLASAVGAAVLVLSRLRITFRSSADTGPSAAGSW